MRGTVSNKLKDFLAQVTAAGQEAKAQGVVVTPALTRSNLENLSAFLPQGPAVKLVKDVIFDAGTHQFNARIYHPAPQQALPVLLHFHGGGHMCGSIELYDSISRELAQRTQSIVITVDYRLSPEHPYPNGLDDCQFALHNYQDVLEGLFFNDTLYIAGDSAGGAICTSLVKRNIEQPQVSISKQILIYPSVDYTLTAPSVSENGQGFLLEISKVQWYFDCYFAKNARDNEFLKQASPLYGPFHQRMPTTLIITAGCDPLRDEGARYAQALAQVGVEVSHHQFDQMIHAYMLLHELVTDECEQTYALIEDFIKQ